MTLIRKETTHTGSIYFTDEESQRLTTRYSPNDFGNWLEVHTDLIPNELITISKESGEIVGIPGNLLFTPKEKGYNLDILVEEGMLRVETVFGRDIALYGMKVYFPTDKSLQFLWERRR